MHSEDRKNILKTKKESDNAYNTNSSMIVEYLKQSSESKFMLAT